MNLVNDVWKGQIGQSRNTQVTEGFQNVTHFCLKNANIKVSIHTFLL